jgi:ABC transporter DrrB family efflux protein
VTTIQKPVRTPVERPPISPPSLLRASSTIVWRNLVHIRRMPEMLLDVTVQSVMFVLLFAFVFGGAIAVAGSNYKEFLLPGIMVQTMVFSSAIVAMGLTSDLQKGIVDRFKSLPIPRSSVLVGRSISSLIHSSIGVAVMAVTGLLIGWRIRNGLVDGVLAFLLLLLFGFALIWLGIWVGSIMRTVESVQGFMFTVMFPLTFVANTFAPTESMPPWLRTIAEWNPVSAVTQACRELWGNGPPAGPDAAWPLQHAVGMSIAWSILLTAIFAPLAVGAFRRRSRD